jgi:hypothetical protein
MLILLVFSPAFCGWLNAQISHGGVNIFEQDFTAGFGSFGHHAFDIPI